MSRKQNSGSQEQKKGILNLGRYHTLSASMSPTTFFFLALSKDQMWHLLSWGAGIIKGGIGNILLVGSDPLHISSV